MSLALRDFATSSKRGLAVAAMALSVFGMNSNALAADQCLPGVYNPAVGVKAKDCYYTAEMNKALKDLNQRTLVYGDRIAFGENDTGVYSVGRLNAFTSNPDGTLGFNIEGDAPAGKPSSQFGVGAVMSEVRLWDRNKPVLPSAEIVGKLNAEGIQKSGDRLMLSAKYGQNVYFVVVARGDDPQIGSFLSANSQRGAGLAGLKNLGYSKLGEELIRQQGGQQVSMLQPR